MRESLSALPRHPLARDETRPSVGDRVRQTAVLVFALGQIAAPGLLFPEGFRSAAPGPGPAPGPTPLEPAGYAFIIWSAIFAGSLAYAVLQARPRAAAEPLYRAIGWRTAIGFAASIGWLVAARFGPLWVTVPLILVMWVTLVSAMLTAQRVGVAVAATSPGTLRTFVQLPLALYAGWLSVAIFANTAEVAHAYKIPLFLAAPVTWSVVGLLAAAAGATRVLVHARYAPGYAAAVVWALLGITVANLTRGLSTLVALTALALACALAAITIGGRRPRSGRLLVARAPGR